jgi:hypothetical protein
VDGGQEPLWAPDGRELFYRRGRRILRVEVAPELKFEAEKPRLHFEADSDFPGWRNYDIAPDGQRFLTVRAQGRSRPTELNVVLHWFEALKRKVKPVRSK